MLTSPRPEAAAEDEGVSRYCYALIQSDMRSMAIRWHYEANSKMENCGTSYLSEDASDDVYPLMLRIFAVQETSVVTVTICTEELLMELLGMVVIITLVTRVFLLSCTWSKGPRFESCSFRARPQSSQVFKGAEAKSGCAKAEDRACGQAELARSIRQDHGWGHAHLKRGCHPGSVFKGVKAASGGAEAEDRAWGQAKLMRSIWQDHAWGPLGASCAVNSHTGPEGPSSGRSCLASYKSFGYVVDDPTDLIVRSICSVAVLIAPGVGRECSTSTSASVVMIVLNSTMAPSAINVVVESFFPYQIRDLVFKHHTFHGGMPIGAMELALLASIGIGRYLLFPGVAGMFEKL
ncbi:ubiquitin carboxyl-terminal hydrolase 8-like isoform X2 [Canna indica]|uniref:Ubiquitin carboxyl-terminal hydrolase 8-like isoform X2 n=1 Tax=Canna indica TaxID=4628 RepID=A0AAQ3KL61_9LILI|nr:ubiquitin carboxyl-terminal hydrolase 8-like isoform X2 [Canna indica]